MAMALLSADEKVPQKVPAFAHDGGDLYLGVRLGPEKLVRRS